MSKLQQRLKDKRALVTGSSSGIGRGIAVRFGLEGAKVAVNYSKSHDGAMVTADAIRRSGGEAMVTRADVSKTEEVDAMISEVVREFGGLDILVNNAGIYVEGGVFAEDGGLLKTSDDLWDRTIDVNLKGAFLCARRAVPEMLKNGRGRIINISSIDGVIAEPNSVAYCSSKAGMIGLTKALALDLAAKKINVNAIAPGQIDTPALADPFLKEESVKKYLAKTPSKRIGLPEDIAAAAVFLASDESDFATGSVFVIDGGWTVQ